MARFELDVFYPNDNQIVIEMPKELSEMFDEGKVFYNGNLFGDPCQLDYEDFADDSALFAYKEAIEANDAFHLNEEGNYSDEYGEQVLYSSKGFYNSFEVDDVNETKRGTIRIVVRC